MLRLLHLGDLHLGAAPTARRGDAAARERVFAALTRVIAEGVARGARLLLFAGDTFDTPTPDPDTVRRFFGILGEAKVPAVIVTGNHDYYTRDGVWETVPRPANVCLFTSPALTCADFPALGVAVYGYSFCAENATVPPLSHTPIAGRTEILLAHADLFSPISPYAPLTAGQLDGTAFSYVALGHIHKPTEPRRVGDATVAYSGFFAGRGFDECGSGQVRFVEIDGARVTAEPIETDADRFEILTADMTGALSGEEVRARAAACLDACGFSEETAVRLIFTGEVGLECRPDAAAIAALGARFSLFEWKDRTLPVFDAGYLTRDPTIRGAFYRAMLPRLQSGDAETREIAAAALRAGLAALAGRGSDR